MSHATPELIGQLLDRHAAALALLARQWCGAAAEDVVQEAFLKLVQQRHPPDQPAAWLFRVVRNGAISAARAAHRRRRYEQEAAELAAAWFVPSDQDRLDARAAALKLAELPLDQREVVIAHLWGGLSFEEIGAMVGCSSSTVHRRYAAGLAALRERLGVSCTIDP